MLEAVVGSAIGKSVVIVADASNSSVLGPPLAAAPHIVLLPGLINGSGRTRFAAHKTFAGLCKAADSVILIGADLMDGLYNPQRSVARFSLLHTASRMGAQSRVTGFSWSEDVASAVRNLPARSDPQIGYFLRDPRSLARFNSLTRGRGQGVADVVFSSVSRASLPTSLAEWTSARQGHYAVVNVSGLIEARTNQRDEYARIVSALRRMGLDLAFVPHVVRGGDGDSEVTALVYGELGGVADFFVSEELTPSQVRELTRGAEVVVTGRMHLAILAATVGTPAVTLATQGKVDGLYDLLGLDAFVVSPTPGFGERVSEVLATYDRHAVRAQIEGRVPQLQRLAAANFVPLD
jgi:polysaccharide pyruvyl transferase WcaK-like protein